ncbi:DUF4296 domain-containing protein [uncultured Eudoraea sp.]|uniref:DUF4296 domain-containing protein n=1 Tax=uncultured Eudoraea sp. TaxID=1035614 RepID=UPI00260BA404|nr:DUF4296 domain-containing protein [uncultured Eudoraea sp.]
MRNIFFLILTISILFSCGEEVIEKPVNLIPKEKMIDILYDLAIINAAKSSGPSVTENANFEPMEYIYNKYKIDSVQFVTSDLYYASLPLEYEDIYKKLEIRIVKEKERFIKSGERKKDSLTKARQN